MTITRVQEASAATTANATSLSVTLAATSAGNFLVAVVVTQVGTCATPTGWTLAISSANGSVSTLYIFYQENIAAGITSQAFANSANNGICAAVWEFSGMATSGSLDATASSPSQAATTAPVTGTTAATAQALELAIGAICQSTSNTEVYSAPLNGFTLETEVSSAGASGNPHLAPLYNILSATGAQSSGVTASRSIAAAGAIATFLGATSGSDPGPLGADLGGLAGAVDLTTQVGRDLGGLAGQVDSVGRLGGSVGGLADGSTLVRGAVGSAAGGLGGVQVAAGAVGAARGGLANVLPAAALGAERGGLVSNLPAPVTHAATIEYFPHRAFGRIRGP